MVLYISLLYSNKSNLSDRKSGLRWKVFTAGSQSIADKKLYITKALVS